MKKSAPKRDPYSVFETLQGDRVGYRKLRALLRERTGITFDDSEAGLLKMANRLTRVLMRHELGSFREYAKLLADEDQNLIAEFVSALTTNTTRFFREASQFDELRKHLPSMLEAKKSQHNPELRAWCTACSTGQEAYTLAICLLEYVNQPGDWKVKILATDIDQKALAKAAQGIYSESELEGLPEGLRDKYFTVLESQNRRYYRAVDALKSMIRFAPFNLQAAKLPFQYAFDIIFCRNVLFYFSKESSTGIVDKLTGVLAEGGRLFVGHTEVGFVRSPDLEMEEHAVYRKKTAERKAS